MLKKYWLIEYNLESYQFLYNIWSHYSCTSVIIDIQFSSKQFPLSLCLCSNLYPSPLSILSFSFNKRYTLKKKKKSQWPNAIWVLSHSYCQFGILLNVTTFHFQKALASSIQSTFYQVNLTYPLTFRSFQSCYFSHNVRSNGVSRKWK